MISGINQLTSAVVNGTAAVQPFLGSVYYVNSAGGGSASSAGTLRDPCLTIQAAVTLAAAQATNKNDVIIVMPDHVETITDGDDLTLSRAGLQVVGIGAGARQPQLRLTTATTATVNISGASTRLVNMRITAAFADVVAAITLSAADVEINGCRIDEEETDENFVDFIKTNTTDNACDGLTVIGCDIIGVDTANDNGINIGGHLDRLRVINNFMRLGIANGEGCIETQTGKNITNALISRNHFVRFNTTTAGFAVNAVGTGNTGLITNNHVVANAAIAVLATAFNDGGGILGMNQNYCAGEIEKSGILAPAVDAD
jgi:hypothetical protein